MKELKTVTESLARHECEGLDLCRMAARRVDGVEHAEPTCSSRPNQIVIDARLRAQVLECGVNIVRPAAPVLTALNLSEFLQARAAFPKAAQIQGQRVDSRRGKLCRYRVPRFAIAIDLMQQQHAWAAPRCGKVGGLQRRAVSSL